MWSLDASVALMSSYITYTWLYNYGKTMQLRPASEGLSGELNEEARGSIKRARMSGRNSKRQRLEEGQKDGSVE